MSNVEQMLAPLPAKREEGLSNQVRQNPSTQCASCSRQRTRTRSRTPTAALHEKRSIRQTPARLPSLRQLQLRRAASSTAPSPTLAGEQPNTTRVAAPALPPPPLATPEAWSDEHGCFETAPIGVATARLARRWGMLF